MISRRTFVAAAGGAALGAVGGYRIWGRAAGAEALAHTMSSGPEVVVYKTPTCGCCAKWVDHIKAAGFQVTVHDDPALDPIKARLGVPKGVRSCHTAVVQDYVLEGHVPAEDIRRLLTERPKVAGLAVPGMPSNVPGMAPEGEPVGDFAVVTFQHDGATAPYARH